MHSKFPTLWMLCNAYDDMSSFNARSKHQRCYSLCIPSPPHPLSVCCVSPPFATIKSPWSLLFFSIPFPRILSRATKSSRRCEARFVSLRWWCNLKRRKDPVHRRSQVSLLVVNLRVHNVLLLSRLFLDLLVLRHVLDNHLLVDSPLSSSISIPDFWIKSRLH